MLTDPPLLHFHLNCMVISSVTWRYVVRDAGWHFSKSREDHSDCFLLTFHGKEKQENKIKRKKIIVSSILLSIGTFLAIFYYIYIKLADEITALFP